MALPRGKWDRAAAERFDRVEARKAEVEESTAGWVDFYCAGDFRLVGGSRAANRTERREEERRNRALLRQISKRGPKVLRELERMKTGDLTPPGWRKCG